MEAIKILITHPMPGEDIYYQAHVQNSGWHHRTVIVHESYLDEA